MSTLNTKRADDRHSIHCVVNKPNGAACPRKATILIRWSINRPMVQACATCATGARLHGNPPLRATPRTEWQMSDTGWEEIDADVIQGGGLRTYYGVATREDYSFTPEAIFDSEQKARGWVEWQQSLWTEEEEKGIPPGAEVYVMPVRWLRGMFWNHYEPLPEDGPPEPK